MKIKSIAERQCQCCKFNK